MVLFVSVFEHLKRFLKYMYIIFKDISGLMIFYFIFSNLVPILDFGH